MFSRVVHALLGLAALLTTSLQIVSLLGVAALLTNSLQIVSLLGLAALLTTPCLVEYSTLCWD